MSKLYIGWSEISITPEKKISLAGQFAERISQYVEKPLTATAMAVEAGGEQMVLVSTDLAATAVNLVLDVRKALAGNHLGLDPEKVIFCAIHTHTGPVYPEQGYVGLNLNMGHSFRSLLESELPSDRKYIESAPISSSPEIATDEEVYALLLERLTQVALEAWKNRAPGSYVNAFGRAAVGMCRRAAYSDGSAQMWGDTNTAVFDALEGGNDSGIELMYVYGEADRRGCQHRVPCPVCPAPSFRIPGLLGRSKKTAPGTFWRRYLSAASVQRRR